ncbi:unnamed protein product [Owenia fusiformis]|uniref:RING-type domain-containing protein n=1 Tax=Owenia fusiformis TaxID=6347 RepID=A0A8S4PMX3_OWEFU|nr:unnamed protein product [Owenia fusiformis]
MGLCKCPKKKVTSLFCFEHRVNVCEHCLVSNHPKCIVQSYLNWLQDSDYSPVCTLCKQQLSNEEMGQCVRLICYDVLHWKCIDRYARQLPPNTAPAGYCCPNCKTGIFPPPNMVSPVADALKSVLSQVNWARAGLGLPLIDEPPEQQSAPAPSTNDSLIITTSHSSASYSTQQQYSPPAQTQFNPPPQYSSSSAPYLAQNTPHMTAQHSSINIGDVAPHVRGSDKLGPRKLFDSNTRGDEILNMSHDHDEDKYKRRSAFQWFSRWFSSRTGGKQKQDPNASMKRILVILILAVIAFFTLVIIFTRAGRASADRDPLLDPFANPNIRVNSED